MWSWFKRKRVPEAPTYSQTRIGELEVYSGTILLADPMVWDLRVEGVPEGRHPVWAMLIEYPEGGTRVARIGLAFSPGAPEETNEQRKLGTIGVDSGSVIAVDEQTLKECWKDVGPERIGLTGTPQHHRKVARLIEKEFGLRWREVNFLQSQFLEPISEELEERITAYLQTFPEYAEFTFMYFRVQTKNTFERVMDAMDDRLWNEVVLDEESGRSLLVISSGFGDGCYDAVGLFRGEELVAVEVEFIGPAQDKVLEAFPMLRY